MVEKKDAKPLPEPKLERGGIQAVANLYVRWIDAGRSSNIMAFMSSLALADLLHSAGLLKDSMYARIGTFADVAFTTGQIGSLLTNSASALKTLAEAGHETEQSIIELLKTLPPGTLAKLGSLEAVEAATAIG